MRLFAGAFFMQPEANYLVLFAGIAGALVFVFAAFPTVSSFYNRLATPLAPVSVAGGRTHFPILGPAAFLLIAVYFANGCLYAFTGGSVAAIFYGLDQKSSILGQLTSNGIGVGFLVGVFIAGIARIRAVYSSLQMIHGALALAMVTSGFFAFYVVLDLGRDGSSLTRGLLDQVAASKENYFKNPLIGVVFAACAASIVEICIVAREKRLGGRGDSPEISLTLLRQRIEDHATVEQVFWPSRVEEATEKCLNDEIQLNGLKSLSWITSTAPSGHIKCLQASLEAWLKSRSIENQTEVSRRLIGANVRIIVPSQEVLTRVTNHCKKIRRFRITQDAIRIRCLIINGNVAIVHLPVPYSKRRDDHSIQSNFAAIITDKSEISRYESWFDYLWNREHRRYFEQFVLEKTIAGEMLTLRVLAVLLSAPLGKRADEILAEVESRGVGVPEVASSLSHLVAKELVVFQQSKEIYVIRRQGEMNCYRDLVSRVLDENISYKSPWVSG